MTGRDERRQLLLDAQEQTEEWARDQRAEYYDAADQRLERRDDVNYPSPSEIAREDAELERERRPQR